MDIGVKHCTIFIIVAGKSPLLFMSACILLTVVQFKLNQSEFIGDFSFDVLQHSKYRRYILFLHCSGFFMIDQKTDLIVFLWYYMT